MEVRKQIAASIPVGRGSTSRAPGIRERLAGAGQFVRFSALGATLLLPLIGVASAGGRLRPAPTLGLVGVALMFHAFAYVLNDVVDLPVDRGEPRRSGSPLVRGTVTRGRAGAFALVQVPAAFVVAARVGADHRAIGALAAAFAGLAVYDLWGKRLRFPPFTDLIQGVGWAGLLLFGAAIQGPWTALTWLLAAFVVVFILMANGVHGSLRDLANDHRCGVRSTAILLGARPGHGSTAVVVPPRLARYAVALHAALFGILLVPFALGEVGRGAVERAASGSALIAVGAVSTWLLVSALRSMGDPLGFRSAGMLHLVVTLAAPVAFLAPSMDRVLLAMLAGGYLVPLLAHPWLPDSVRWAGRRLGVLRDLVWVTRAENCLAGGAAILVGAHLATAGWSVWTPRLVRASVSVCLIVGASNVVNDLRDVRVDRLEKPHRPIPSGRLSPRAARLLAATLGIGGCGLAWSLGFGLGSLATGLLLLALAYSLALKSTVLVGNAVVAFLAAVTVPYGALVAGRVDGSAVLAAAIIFPFVLSFEVLKSIADRRADAEAGVRTVATQLPLGAALWVHRLWAVSFVGLVVIASLAGLAPARYVVVVIPAAVLPTLGVLVALRRPDERRIRIAARVAKAGWFPGLVAMAFLR